MQAPCTIIAGTKDVGTVESLYYWKVSVYPSEFSLLKVYIHFLTLLYIW